MPLTNACPVWQRPNFDSSPSIARSLDAALKVSNVTKENIDLFDFYSLVSPVPSPRMSYKLLTPQSCFPIVPKLARHHLSLPESTPLTLLGGLTSFGGAGNNYSMHALTEMTRQLRQRKNSGSNGKGLVLANGGVLTYQHVTILSTSPRKGESSYPSANPLSAGPLPCSVPAVQTEATGPAVIEVWLPICCPKFIAP